MVNIIHKYFRLFSNRLFRVQRIVQRNLDETDMAISHTLACGVITELHVLQKKTIIYCKVETYLKRRVRGGPFGEILEEI